MTRDEEALRIAAKYGVTPAAAHHLLAGKRLVGLELDEADLAVVKNLNANPTDQKAESRQPTAESPKKRRAAAEPDAPP